MAMMSYVHEIQTVFNVAEDPQMVLLSPKGACGVSVRREKVCMLLPQRSKGGTLENHAFHRQQHHCCKPKQTLLALSTSMYIHIWPGQRQPTGQ